MSPPTIRRVCFAQIFFNEIPSSLFWSFVLLRCDFCFVRVALLLRVVIDFVGRESRVLFCLAVSFLYFVWVG